MKRAGFTMIELIFVIVILGILAAVAVPKLAATRDDANIAKSVTEISTVITDFGSYYTAQGRFGGSAVMTNVTLLDADQNISTGAYYVVNGTNCIDFNTSVLGLAEGNVSVTNLSAGATAEPLCAKIQGVVTAQDLNKTHSFGGNKVNFGS